MKIEGLPLKYRLKDLWFRIGIPKYHNRNNIIYNGIYRIWIMFSIYIGFIKRYNVHRDKSLINARKSLEDAFAPQLKKMLEEEIYETE